MGSPNQICGALEQNVDEDSGSRTDITVHNIDGKMVELDGYHDQLRHEINFHANLAKRRVNSHFNYFSTPIEMIQHTQKYVQ